MCVCELTALIFTYSNTITTTRERERENVRERKRGGVSIHARVGPTDGDVYRTSIALSIGFTELINHLLD